MASVASPRRQRYARWAMRASYADHHLIGFEIWDASHRLPPDLINALSGTSTRKTD
jgi:hypothetical protein